MSVMSIGNKTLDALVTLASQDKKLIGFGITRLGQQIRNFNLKSAYGKYSKEIEMETYKFTYYKWDLSNPESWLQVAFLVNFVMYQCSEAPDLESAECLKGMSVYSNMTKEDIVCVERTIVGSQPKNMANLSFEQKIEKLTTMYAEMDYSHSFAEGNSRVNRAFTAEVARASGV